MNTLDIKTGSPVVSWLPHELGVEELQMIKNVANLPCIYKHVALMPDAHLGKGAMIGSVIATRDALIPAAVGVDIGCGMIAKKLPFKASTVEGKLRDIRLSIESKIPVGFEGNSYIEKEVDRWKGWQHFKRLHSDVLKKEKKALNQLGSLGGGNHFIEVCIDYQSNDPNLWLMLHSGSRHIGNAIAGSHIRTAKLLRKMMDVKGPDPELSYFVKGTKEFQDYWEDLQWAQQYAMKNREIMMDRIMRIMAKYLNEGVPIEVELSVNCHHNYACLESHYGEKIYVTRKGALQAGGGVHGIIPGSMGTKSYIVKGKGNSLSFNSCSHGAGRRMSRTKAKKQFTLEDFKKQTEGVECRKDKGVLDEIPGAYKDIDQIIDAQSDLVEIVACLKQILCVKG